MNTTSIATLSKTFNSDEFGQIRTVTIDKEPWFVGKDIATALGYIDAFGALKKHVDTEDKQNCQNDSFDTPRGMTIVNESGLYSLILSSKLPTAKRFKRWVTSEVLPDIRKNGYYVDANNVDTPITREELAMYFNCFMNSFNDSLNVMGQNVNNSIKELVNIIEIQNKELTEIKLLNSSHVLKTKDKTISEFEKEWLHKAWKTAREISKMSGKDSKYSLVEAYNILRKKNVNINEMYEEFKKDNPGAAKINMCAENELLRLHMDLAFEELRKKYSKKNVVVKPINKSKMFRSVPKNIKNRIEKSAKKRGNTYYKERARVYKDIEKMAGINLKDEAKAYAISNGLANCSKAYYVSMNDKCLNILKQVTK